MLGPCFYFIIKIFLMNKCKGLTYLDEMSIADTAGTNKVFSAPSIEQGVSGATWNILLAN